MSVATIEPTVATRPAAVRPTLRSTEPVRMRRPRRTGPGVGPSARPAITLPAPTAASAPRVRPQACRVEVAAPAVQPGRVRLTERGIAVVLVAAVLIVTAAVVVIGLTAFRVTGDGYRGADGVRAPITSQS